MNRLVLAVLVLPLAACATSMKSGEGDAVHTLTPEYSPLVEIRERPDFVLPESAITTIGTKAYVVDLADWLTRHPPDSPTYKAKLAHEHIHSSRQLKQGVTSWISGYLVSADFMWAEEQIGWYYEITTLQRLGLQVNVDGVALILNGYRTAAGSPMVSFPEAKTWVIDVLDGRWKPGE
jgi:hypothetical protein